jgi:hypothetical protein
VCELHQIVEPGAHADDRVSQRTSIDRCVRANLHIVVHDHTAQLQHAREALTRDGEAEPSWPIRARDKRGTHIIRTALAALFRKSGSRDTTYGGSEPPARRR